MFVLYYYGQADKGFNAEKFTAKGDMWHKNKRNEKI